jgi:hypothetical protein
VEVLKLDCFVAVGGVGGWGAVYASVKFLQWIKYVRAAQLTASGIAGLPGFIASVVGVATSIIDLCVQIFSGYN